MKELFKALEISENNDKNLAKKLQLERIIEKQKWAIAHHLTLSGDEWTEHDQQSLESMTEGLRSYVFQLNYLKKYMKQISRDTLTPTLCCTVEEHLEFDMEGYTDGVEVETWKCKQCNKSYRVPIEIVRDFDNMEYTDKPCSKFN